MATRSLAVGIWGTVGALDGTTRFDTGSVTNIQRWEAAAFLPPPGSSQCPSRPTSGTRTSRCGRLLVRATGYSTSGSGPFKSLLNEISLSIYSWANSSEQQMFCCRSITWLFGLLPCGRRSREWNGMRRAVLGMRWLGILNVTMCDDSFVILIWNSCSFESLSPDWLHWTIILILRFVDKGCGENRTRNIYQQTVLFSKLEYLTVPD